MFSWDRLGGSGDGVPGGLFPRQGTPFNRISVPVSTTPVRRTPRGDPSPDNRVSLSHGFTCVYDPRLSPYILY